MTNEILVMIVYALYYLVFFSEYDLLTYKLFLYNKFHVDQHSAVYEYHKADECHNHYYNVIIDYWFICTYQSINFLKFFLQI